MIQTKIQFNLKNAKQYFREHLGAGDYYSEGQKTEGEWLAWVPRDWVEGCRRREEAFIALCEGKHPENRASVGPAVELGPGVRVTRWKANRRIFFDFTIAPPKSVSVVGLFQDARIVALHERRSASHAGTRNAGGGARA